MISIQYNFDSRYFESISYDVRISTNGNNLLYMTDTGKIAMHEVVVGINKNNTPGDGFDGVVDQPIPVVRFNNTVSRKQTGDPTSSNEGVCIPDLLNGYWVSKGLDPD